MKYRLIFMILLGILYCCSLYAQVDLNKAKNRLIEKAQEKNSTKQSKSKQETTNSDPTETTIPKSETPTSESAVEEREEDSDDDEEKAPAKYAEYTGVIPPPIRKGKYNQPVGTILFSKTPISYGKEDKKEITNTFKAGDQVFGMAYLSDSKIKLGFERGYKVWIHDAEDGRGYSCAYEFGAEPYKTLSDGTNNGDQKYYDLDIFATHEDAWDKGLTANLLDRLQLHIKQAPMSLYGTNARKVHRLKVEIGNFQGLTIAEGTFYYDLTTGEEKIFDMHKTHTGAALKEFKLPASKRNDPTLAEKIKKIMQAEGVDVQRVIFSTADWGIVRHEISGVVLRRTIWAYIVYKNKKGECHYDDVQFAEEYIGNSFSGVIKKKGYGTAHGQLLCENINK